MKPQKYLSFIYLWWDRFLCGYINPCMDKLTLGYAFTYMSTGMQLGKPGQSCQHIHAYKIVIYLLDKTQGLKMNIHTDRNTVCVCGICYKTYQSGRH